MKSFLYEEEGSEWLRRGHGVRREVRSSVITQIMIDDADNWEMNSRSADDY
jgi:hypothetical protein